MWFLRIKETKYVFQRCERRLILKGVSKVGGKLTFIEILNMLT
jgi:hypothetical protein